MRGTKSNDVFIGGFMKQIDLCEGKYTIRLTEDCKLGDTFIFDALRYGESWRNLCGDSLVLALVQKIIELEDRLK